MLAPFRAASEASASRKQMAETARPFDARRCLRYVFSLPADGLSTLGQLAKHDETTRGPPLMMPSLSC
ncbi:MAG: hypothetical protein WDO13_01230 [Verrucomicrobiota bacterium]